MFAKKDVKCSGPGQKMITYLELSGMVLIGLLLSDQQPWVGGFIQ